MTCLNKRIDEDLTRLLQKCINPCTPLGLDRYKLFNYVMQSEVVVLKCFLCSVVTDCVVIFELCSELHSIF